MALSLIQKIEDNIRVHLNNVKNVNYPGVFMYDFLKECGIDSSTIDQVTFLFQEILQSRAEYFPNSSTCYSEIIVDLLKLLFNEKNQFPPSRINKWIVMLYYQEDYVYKKETHRYEQVECIHLKKLFTRSLFRLLVYGLLCSYASIIENRNQYSHFHIVSF